MTSLVKYKPRGRTELQVSRLALGTMNFGELTDETVSFKIMDTALDAGSPTPEVDVRLDLHSVGTAGFEFNGPHAGPLFFRHLRAPNDRIGSYWLPWTGKHYGKHISHHYGFHSNLEGGRRILTSYGTSAGPCPLRRS